MVFLHGLCARTQGRTLCLNKDTSFSVPMTDIYAKLEKNARWDDSNPESFVLAKYLMVMGRLYVYQVASLGSLPTTEYINTEQMQLINHQPSGI